MLRVLSLFLLFSCEDMLTNYPVSFEVPQKVNGLYEWFRPLESTISYDENNKMILQGLSPYGQQYLSTDETKNPTFTPPNILGFDNTDDELFHLLRPKIVNRTVLPDLSDSVSGKGWTCTGIEYDPIRETFWIMNEGRSTPSDPTYRPSIIEMDLGLTTILNEFDLSLLVPGIQSCQGITIDTSDQTLWVAALLDNKIYHFSKAGALLSGTITVSSGDANGLAYDAELDEFWTCKQNSIKRYDKSGNVTYTNTSISVDFDLCAFDNNSRMLYLTTGTNAVPPHTVSVLDVSLNRFYQQFYILQEVQAIEGITFIGTQMYVCSDEYFHVDLFNEVVQYDIGIEMGKLPLATSLMWCGVLRADQNVNVGGEIIWSQHSSGVNRPGLRLSYTTLTTGTFEASTSIGTSEKSSLSISQPSLINYRIFVVVYDVSAGTVGVYIDGTLDSSATGFLPVSPLRMLPGIVGNWLSSARFSDMDMKEFTVHLNNISQSDRERMEGYLAWEHGLEGSLPALHPYKNEEPN